MTTMRSLAASRGLASLVVSSAVGSALVVLGGCSSAGREEEARIAHELEGAASQVVLDQAKIEDALDDAEAWLAAGERRELDAYAEKHEAAPVERLRKVVTAKRALEDLRAVIREERKLAATIAATGTMLQDPAAGDDEAHQLGAKLLDLDIALKADRREEQIALDRWRRARAALGAEAFGGKHDAREHGIEPAPPK